MKKYLLLFSILVFSFSTIAQNKADSLKNALVSPKDDTTKVNLLNLLAWELKSSNTNASLEYAKQALTLAQHIQFISGLIRAYNNVGIAQYFKGSYPEALNNYFAAIKLLEKNGDKKKLSSTYNNIAAIYLNLLKYNDAENYFYKSLKIDMSVDDKLGVAESYNNIGIIYHDQNKEDEALICYFKSLHIRESINDVEGLPSTYSNIGTSLIKVKDYEKADDYLCKALHAYKTNGDSMGIALAYTNLGDLFIQQDFFKNAKEYYDSSIVISKKNTYLDYLSYDYKMAAATESQLGNYQQAYELHKLYALVNDTIYNKDNTEQVAEMQTKYETEKKEKEIVESKAESEKQTSIKNMFIIAFVLMMVLAFIIFRGYKGKQRSNEIITAQKQEVELQKEIAEIKSKEILDSINYAKRIQEAILPPDAIVKQFLPESFILYMPKDIVSGDFYWIEPWGDKILFAAVDCTGHGVPGALMSIVGYNLLGKAVNELGLSRPALILNSLSKGIGKTLRQTGRESEVKDGMDIALCALDTKTNLLEYSGAFNPLYIIRNGVLMETHSDKNPIGTYLNGELQNYTNHEIQLQKGDTIYIFTDGYADQFGGEKGKKFKYKPLQQLLISIQQYPMSEQNKILQRTINEWKGSLEQVDDILIMGVRI